MVASDEVNVNWIDESFDVVPLETVSDVIVIVGDVPSNVHVNWVAAVFPLPAASVNAPASTSIVHKPSPSGVKLAV